MKSIAIAVTAALCIGTGAAAEEFGRVEASLDGQSMTWVTLVITQGNETDASATFSVNRFASDLHIQGHPRPSFTTSDVLSIDLMYRGDIGPGTTPIEAEITYMPTGMRPPFWTSARSGVPVTISFDVLMLEGDVGRATGTFSGRICRTEILTDDPDTNDCRQIEGRIDTQVLIEE